MRSFTLRAAQRMIYPRQECEVVYSEKQKLFGLLCHDYDVEGKIAADLTDEVRKTTIFVFAGGYAKRLERNQPKALVTVAGQPLIDRCIRFFGECGFKDFVFFLGHGFQEISDFIADGKGYGIETMFLRDPAEGCGKGMALRHALEGGGLDETKRSLVTFPDEVFTDPSLPLTILLRHLYGVRNHAALASLVITERIRWPYGLVEKDTAGFVTKFQEKPVVPLVTSVGVSVLEPSVYELVRREIPLDTSQTAELDRVYAPLSLSRKLYGIPIPHECWYPINTEKDLSEAEAALRAYKEYGENGKNILRGSLEG